MREITFDTETTGMDPSSGHRIIEIGCVELVDKVRTGEVFHTYINPQRDVPRASTDVHGLTAGFLSDKPIFKDIAKDFIDFIAGDNLVIHNASFDMKFINSELEKAKLEPLSYDRAVDTLTIARNKFPGAKASLDALCNRYGIDLSARDKHGALLDAELLAEVYIELIGGRQGTMQLDANRVVHTEKGVKKRKFYNPRDFKVAEEEAKAHEEFLKKIKEPLWG